MPCSAVAQSLRRYETMLLTVGLQVLRLQCSNNILSASSFYQRSLEQLRHIWSSVMKSVLQWVLATVVAVSVSSVVLAGPQRDAGSKARGDIYHFWNARSHNTHAHQQAQSLYHYGQTQDVVAAPPAKEHITSVQQGVAASQKSLAELKKNHPDNKEALAAIAKIEEIQKKVLAQCEHVEKELGTDDANSETITSCCVELHHDLDLAAAELNKLKKALKIEDPKIPAKDAK